MGTSARFETHGRDRQLGIACVFGDMVAIPILEHAARKRQETCQQVEGSSSFTWTCSEGHLSRGSRVAMALDMPVRIRSRYVVVFSASFRRQAC